MFLLTTAWTAHDFELALLLWQAVPTVCLDLGRISGERIAHGALVIALRNPAQFRSVSAFAPVAALSKCPWGEKTLMRFLGADRSRWQKYDASELAATQRYDGPILIDQGRADKFLTDQLKPHLFEEAHRASATPLKLRLHDGYDHSYYFISTFIEDHMRHHASILHG